MVLPRDNRYLWLAEEGMMSGLPDGWEERIDDEGVPYSLHILTGQTMIGNPLDAEFCQRYERLKQQDQNGKEREKIKENATKSMPKSQSAIEDNATLNNETAASSGSQSLSNAQPPDGPPIIPEESVRRYIPVPHPICPYMISPDFTSNDKQGSWARTR